MPSQETEVRTLTGPVDLSDDVYDDVGVVSCWFFIQNTGGVTLRFREGGSEPALDAGGHILAVGDGVVVLVLRQRSFWVWPPTGAGELTISAGAPAPTRDA